MYNHQIFNTSSPDGKIGIDFDQLHGYWERRDGSEGGELWFELNENGCYELIDFDGAYELPARVIDALLTHGIMVDEVFFP